LVKTPATMKDYAQAKKALLNATTLKKMLLSVK
jgi:hypothetical protein